MGRNNNGDSNHNNNDSKMMKYLTVLDAMQGRVWQFKVDFQDVDLGAGDIMSQHEQCEVFLDNEGFKLSNIDWMIHSDGTINKG